ncbi:MAG: hypothetical protein AAGF47_04070 [Planctomycetota bacterium]
MLAHSIRDLILCELDLELAAANAADHVAHPGLAGCLREMGSSAIARILRLRRLLRTLSGTDDFNAEGDTRPLTHPVQAVSADSHSAAIDMAVLATLRRMLAAGQRLYADTAVRAMRWDLDPVGPELAHEIEPITRLLGRLEEFDADIARATPSQTDLNQTDPNQTDPNQSGPNDQIRPLGEAG